MIYRNICMMPPMTDRPATASLTPYETAAPLLFDAVGLDPVEVPLGSRDSGLSVDLQVSDPRTTPLLTKLLQSI
jgi:hypothetical protein